MLDYSILEKINTQVSIHDADLVIVTKYQPIWTIEELINLWYSRFWENYVQQLTTRKSSFPHASFDMIWHLQSNKIKYIAGNNSLIQSIDSHKLLWKLADYCNKFDIKQNVLLQVNIKKLKYTIYRIKKPSKNKTSLCKTTHNDR